MTCPKYSFPSKNIEYMLSGTPILTTRLTGMPEVYYPYVYIFDDESIDGFASKLSEIMDYTIAEINAKGKGAQAFISKSKNAKNQARRIVSLCQF